MRRTTSLHVAFAVVGVLLFTPAGRAVESAVEASVAYPLTLPDPTTYHNLPASWRSQGVSFRMGHPFLACSAVDQYSLFQNYWVGSSFEDLRMLAVTRDCQRPVAGELPRVNLVSYIYGDCAAIDEKCRLPIQIHSAPSIERNKNSLDLLGTDTTVYGVPATRYEDGLHLEVYFPGSTVIISGDKASRVDRFAKALKEGPSLLTDLERFGIEFDSECVDDRHYCVGRLHGL